LQKDGDVEGEAKDRVWGLEVLVSRSSLVNLNDDEPSEEGCDSNEVDEEMGYCACTFLRGGMRGLENEGGLSYEKEAGLGNVSMLFDITGDGFEDRALTELSN
jgi:hypothetical protein